MRYKHHKLTLIACLIFVAAYVPRRVGAVPSKQVSPEIIFLAAGVKNGRDNLNSAQAEVVVRDTTFKEFFEIMRTADDPPAAAFQTDQDQHADASCEWYINDKHEAMYVKLLNNYQATLRQVKFSGDEKQAKVLYRHERILPSESETQNKTPTDTKYHFSLGTISESDSVFKNGIWGEFSNLDPRTYTYFIGQTPLDEFLLDKNLHFQVEGEELIDQSHCVEVVADLGKGESVKIWVDTDHGYEMRRKELFLTGLSGQVYRTQLSNSMNFTESNGIWMPSDIQIDETLPKVALPGHENLDFSIPVETRSVSISIKNFKAQIEIPRELLDLEFDPGTSVDDAVKNLHYVTPRRQPSDLDKSEVGSKEKK